MDLLTLFTYGVGCFVLGYICCILDQRIRKARAKGVEPNEE